MSNKSALINIDDFAVGECFKKQFGEGMLHDTLTKKQNPMKRKKEGKQKKMLHTNSINALLSRANSTATNCARN